MACFSEMKEAKMKMENLDRETDFFSATRAGHVAVIQFKHAQSDWILHLDGWRYALAYLDVVSLEACVKIVVLVHQPGAFVGRRRCFKVYDHLRDGRIESAPLREVHDLLDQYLLRIMGSSKFFIDVHSGSMILDSLLLSFACDYRIMADTATVQNPAAHAGLIPRGTGVFLFRRVLGSTHTYDLLLSDEQIRADELLRLGLVDKVVPLHQLPFTALETAGRFAGKSGALLADVKKLVNHGICELREYLNLEKSVSAWAGDSSEPQ